MLAERLALLLCTVSKGPYAGDGLHSQGSVVGRSPVALDATPPAVMHLLPTAQSKDDGALMFVGSSVVQCDGRLRTWRADVFAHRA